MRSLFFVLLLSSSAFANTCPDLAGQYYCSYINWDGQYSLTIEQSVTDGVTTYQFTNKTINNYDEYIADGLTYEFEDNGFDVSLTSTCENGTLISKEAAVQPDQNFEVFQDREFKLSSPSQLDIQVVYKSTFEGEIHSNGSYYIKCDKNL